MKWLEAFNAARAAQRDGDSRTAEMHFDHAVYEAQREQGPINLDLADCLVAYAEFLGQEHRYGDAMFRLKLAAAIHKAMGNAAAAMQANALAAAMRSERQKSIA